MDEKYSFVVESGGIRLDKFLADHVESLSRSYIGKLINDGRAFVNGKPAKASEKLSPGETVELDVPPPQVTSVQPEEIPLKIVYEDSDIIVVDKPAGLVVHPAPGHAGGTLVNALLAHSKDLAGIGGELRPGIVHRLDKDTSGLLVVAKNDNAHHDLAEQIKSRTVTKEYIALIEGRLEPAEGIIEAPIGRSSYDRKKMAITARGREAVTRYRVWEYLDGYTLVRVFLETGRTHQIRVHFAGIGHPVVGDPVYGKKSPLIDRQFLHAAKLGFKLPSTGEYREFDSSLPPDLQKVIDELSGRIVKSNPPARPHSC